MKKIMNFVGIAVFCVVLPFSVFGQNTEHEILVKEYKSAIAKGDPEEINKVWSQINADPTVQRFMQETYPNQYRSYYFWGMHKRLERMKTASPEAGYIPPPRQAISGGDQSDPSNSETAAENPNRVKPSQAGIEPVDANQRSISNSRLPTEASNRFRESNQKQIRARKNN